MSTLGVFIALGGTSYAVARNSIGAPQLKDNAVTSPKIRNGSVSSEDLAPGTLLSGRRGPRGAGGPAGTSGPTGPAGSLGPTGPAGPGASAEAWKALPFAAGWANYGGVYDVGAYRKDSSGVVHLRGLVTRTAGAPVGDGAIAQLPVGYRPQYRMLFGVHTGLPSAFGRIDVLPSGAVQWSGGSTGEMDWTSFAGIEFPTD